MDMQEITYNTYLEALEIVRRFHQQILARDVELSRIHKDVESKVLNNSKNGLLTDFLLDHYIPRRVYTGILGSFPNGRDIFSWTVEFFLSKYLKEVRRYRTLGIMRGVSAKTMTNFLIIASENGYHDYVKPFEEYYVKK